MKMRARLSVLLATIVIATLGFTAPAQAWGDKTKCAGAYDNPENFHTNRWDFFAGHHMDVYVAQCDHLSPQMGLDWTRTPTITFPSRFNPAALAEELSVSKKPWVVATGTNGGQVTMVRYRYQVKQTVAKIPVPIYFDFTLTYTMLGSTICSVGGSCDTLHTW